ncbi:MAG: cytochrome c3 family protein [Desulfuromonadaceae bacterium]|nr:cytochrome c3 family protein [Desulfuromonadaceae bacterium]
MKKIIVVLSLVAFAGSAFAADVIEMKRGVKFNHKAHQANVSGGCKVCHEKGPGKIEGFGKDLAHGKACKACHVEMKKGPTSCKDCHKP